MYVVNGYTMKEVETIKEAKAEIKKQLEKNKLSYNKVFRFKNEEMIIEIYEYCTLYKETFLILKSLKMQKYIDICPEYKVEEYRFESSEDGKTKTKVTRNEMEALVEWEKASENRNLDWWDLEIKGCINIGNAKL